MDFFIHCEAMVYHHRTKCDGISSAVGCIWLRNDDMQSVALMICNSFGIDDMHGFAVILSTYLS
ncbi:MAG: hypothetical protein J6L61_04505 [Ruminiclostridium sp.]|nr:hypothetical protein [Ruminiclostridium sp.]